MEQGQRCSVRSAGAGEPLAGTSATASSWLCIEQPGPWGRDGLVDSHLDREVGERLAALAAGSGVRIALIRRPGNHPDQHHQAPRRVYLAHTAPGRTWLRAAEVADPKLLCDLDFGAFGAGEDPRLGELATTPLLLVCTNSKRDVCCAVYGRPIAAALADTHRDQVWECTHIGGHRFAPTAVVLPAGYSYGRLDTATAGQLLDGSVLVRQCRGRSTWSPAGQVAELAVRELTGDTDPDALSVDATTVTHRDGRRWQVHVAERPIPLRPASCGAEPAPATALVAGEVYSG